MSDLKSKIQGQRVRVAMNTKHLTVQSGDTQLVRLENGQYRELPVRDISFHREGEENESPYTRFYDLSDPRDAEDIAVLRQRMEENPALVNDVAFRVQIVGEYEIFGGLPWPGYDDQNPEQVVTTWQNMAASVKPELEKVVAYELGKDEPNEDKIAAIEKLHASLTKQARDNTAVGAKL